MKAIDILLCYRGRYYAQVKRLDFLLESRGLRTMYDEEILSRDVDYKSAEVNWISLGISNNDKRTTWRGPLSEAVKHSSLLVFLINPQDPSENVMNEIAWAARSGKPLFLVFDTKADSHSEDWEGLNIGFLQSFYGMVTGRPESPAFGYHFVTHKDDQGLDERLSILVDRIVSYLEKVKERSIPKLRLDDGAHLSEYENSSLARARRQLQYLQTKISKSCGIDHPLSRGDALQNTLNLLYNRERDGRVHNGRIYPCNSPFSYPEQSERERYRLTEVLINQIRPESFEIPELLEMFARELTSIKMTLPDLLRRTILIGTLPFCHSNRPIDVVIESDYIILLIDRAYADFVYQMLKIGVMTWKILSPIGSLPVSFSIKREDTEEIIASKPELVDGFARSLNQMLQKGRPGSSTEVAPPTEYHPAISLISVFQKRYILSVALARLAIFAPDSRNSSEKTNQSPESNDSLDPNLKKWIIEADNLAIKWVFESAINLDETDPTAAFQGILLSHTSNSLIERTLVDFTPAEIIPSELRMQSVSEYFKDYMLSTGTTNEDVIERLNAARNIVNSLDSLLKTANERGLIGMTNLESSNRWRRNIRK